LHARWPIPANRGRIIDRNGLILASSVRRPASGPFPKTCRATIRSAQAGQTARHAAGRASSASSRTRTRPSSGSSARSTNRWARKSMPTGLKGVYQRKEYRANTPRAKPAPMWWVSPTSRTSGRKESNSRSTNRLAGRAGSRRVIKDRLGRVVESRRRADPAGRRPRPATEHRQQGAVLRLPEAARCGADKNKAKAGSVVVLDAHHRRGAGAGQLPELCHPTNAAT
jgi:cell division protein FtsI (penicillin-binding protein 3)